MVPLTLTREAMSIRPDGPAAPAACSQSEAVAMLNLMPIPAAVIVQQCGEFAFPAVNRRFVEAGFGCVAAESPVARLLGPALRDFFASDLCHAESMWQFGDEIDCRYFRVTFARRSGVPGVDRALVTLIDQTAEQRTEQSLRREMMTDSLTGLANRVGFSDALERLVPPERAADYALLVVNLDRFSRVNASMGGIAGDELLISVARRLKGLLRAGDVLARLNGDEFAVLMLAEGGSDDARQVGRRIRTALSVPFRLSGFEVRVDCAIGIALGSDRHDDCKDLIRNAQIALKRSRQSGRVETCHVSASQVARARFGLETRLRQAIETDALTLHFQPVCEFASGRIVSFEALARWTGDDGVYLSPDQFIPVAEESGLIVPLGRWATDEAARTLAIWNAAAGKKCDVRVSVNLSAIQLQRDDLPSTVRAALERHAVPSDQLTLELTESAIGTDPDHVAQVMVALKEMGATLAMDDFGTGYSNLAHLQKLPIDLLKIDRSFVSGMIADRDKAAIVRAILSLASALGMTTIAEGVETVDLAQRLAALGCTQGQGYLFGRPMSGDQAYRLLVERNS